jgi:hypothetical protein
MNTRIHVINSVLPPVLSNNLLYLTESFFSPVAFFFFGFLVGRLIQGVTMQTRTHYVAQADPELASSDHRHVPLCHLNYGDEIRLSRSKKLLIFPFKIYFF